MDDSEYRDRLGRQLIDAAKKSRGYADFWEWPDQHAKEASIMEDFLGARNKMGLQRYAKVEQLKNDPPDFVATDIEGCKIAIELTELVSEKAIRANLRAKEPKNSVWQDWTQEDVVAAVEKRLQDKDSKKYLGGPYNEIHVVLHVDEPLVPRQEYVPFLGTVTLAARRQISSAFVLFSFDPATDSYPLVTLNLGK
jgi:hypothetical protein